jgi:hypothetical protein
MSLLFGLGVKQLRQGISQNPFAMAHHGVKSRTMSEYRSGRRQVCARPNNVRVFSQRSECGPRTMSECRSDPRTMSECLDPRTMSECRSDPLNDVRVPFRTSPSPGSRHRTVSPAYRSGRPVQFSQRTVQPAYSSASVLFSQRTVQPAYSSSASVPFSQRSCSASVPFSQRSVQASVPFSQFRSGHPERCPSA